ncbi:MAG TPA: succinate dehydrogenase/fumarate reductase iron-sulfur subunit [Acidimicrobiales bacterium]|nr:succinate dehydrogenase/fumarate reductase iron-sulfur subunit [Acidimicrobiales bacterium]
MSAEAPEAPASTEPSGGGAAGAAAGQQPATPEAPAAGGAEPVTAVAGAAHGAVAAPVSGSGARLPASKPPAGSAALAVETVTLRAWRGDAGGGEFRDYVLPANEGEVVLDVVHRVQAEQAPDLAVRWNCKAGKCGSCSAEVNGMPRLMCMTRMSTLPPGEPVVVSPMRGFPVIRDLVTDVSFNFAMARRMPALRPGPKEPDGTYRMFQEDIERGQEFRKCIECFLCMNVCHVIRDHEENKPRFAGPRFLIRIAELEMHPLDTLDRRRYVSEELGIGLCNITKCCTEVCPEHIHITDNAIIPLKERVVDARFDPVARIGRRLRRRPDPTAASEIAAMTPAGRTGEVIATVGPGRNGAASEVVLSPHPGSKGLG